MKSTPSPDSQPRQVVGASMALPAPSESSDSSSMPAVPPMPAGPPAVPSGPGAAMQAWLRTPRRADGPGVYAFGHTPRPPDDPDRIPDRRLVGTGVGSLIGMWLTNSIIHHHLYWLWLRPLVWTGFAPSGHAWSLAEVHRFLLAQDVWTVVWWALLAAVFGRTGHWLEIWRRYLLPIARRVFPRPARMPAVEAVDPAAWPQLRAAGQHAAADRLALDLAVGRLGDVDHVRLTRAWQTATDAGPAAVEAFSQEVVARGAGALPHPSGARGLPVPRTARHDLMAGQVLLGAVADDPRNPGQFRGAGAALDPGVLGTSVVAVGPSGSGKTRRLVRPVVESLCLQALTGTAAVVAVGARGAGLGGDGAFDVVIAPGEPGASYGLDLYAGTVDPDAAAELLADALLDGREGEVDPRRAATVLVQVLGPFRAAHGRFPGVAELRTLLDGDAAAVGSLREVLEEAGEPGWMRELDARARQTGRPGDVGAVLAERVALLDRPAFAASLGAVGRAGTGPARLFALTPGMLERPLRVRVDLPEHGHTEGSRILARLLVAQFTAAATGRGDRGLFAGLVLDDATGTITGRSVRGLQRLRPARAGAVLALRSLDDVPEALRGPLLGAAGCRIALAGVPVRDGREFAQAWGTAWTTDSDVTRTPDQSGGASRRLVRGVRRLVTGEAVTTEAVTVRRVERDRWSASDLAGLPAGHAVMSFTAVTGETTVPLLVDLRGHEPEGAQR